MIDTNNEYVDLVCCEVSIEKICKTLISELSDALAMDEDLGSAQDISNDIKCLSYVKTVKDFAIVEFNKRKIDDK